MNYTPREHRFFEKSGTSCYLEAKPQGSREQPSRASLTSELAASASQLCCPLVEIVVSVAYAWRAPDTPFLLPFRSRFIAHRARSDSIALAGYPALKEFKARLWTDLNYTPREHRFF